MLIAKAAPKHVAIKYLIKKGPSSDEAEMVETSSGKAVVMRNTSEIAAAREYQEMKLKQL